MIPLLLGSLLGVACSFLFFRFKYKSFNSLADRLLHQAENEIERKKQETLLQLKKEENEKAFQFQTQWHEEQKKSEERRIHLQEREERLTKLATLLEKREQATLAKERLLKEEKEQLSGLSAKEARALVLEETEKTLEKEIHRLYEEQAVKVEEEAERSLLRCLSRCTLATAHSALISTLFLPSDEMKRRIIGKEGRNIRTLEELSGVNLLIEEAPNVVVISSYDPERREIAKMALMELIQDGRIYPTRIEEALQKSREQLQKTILLRGEEACTQSGVFSLHPELVRLLGKLHFHECQGQNVLAHSLEVSLLMGYMAAECGASPSLARRIGLLHDIGKVVPNPDLSHALAGREWALKYGEKEEVANGIGAHHDEMAPQTVEAALCSLANRISGERIGARLPHLEQTFTRMRKLEMRCRSFPGVMQAFALQSGRELRVIVEPNELSEARSQLLARTLASKIEEEFSFGGRMKITVIRETRSTEYAG